ncbi:MAG: ATP-dependent DNA ligase [Planctomycetota bacterium]
MLLAEVVETSRRVAATRARKEKVEQLADLLRRAPPGAIEAIVAMLAGELRQGKIGLGGAAIHPLRVAPAATAALRVAEVDQVFTEIAGQAGAGSQGRRANGFQQLLGRATEPEQDFLRRLVVGELRQGALQGLVIEGVARATAIPAASVRRAVMLRGALAPVAVAALTRGAAGLAAFSLQPLRFVQPMLAQSADSVAEAVERLDDAALEWKIDGARVQVHRVDEEIAVFSRTGKNVSAAVPEVVEAVRGLSARQLVLDGEVIALRADGRPRPFQETMRRFGRRLDVARLRAELPLTPFFFDVLHADGVDVLDACTADRAERLAELVAGSQRVPRLVSADAGAAAAFLEDALAQGHEGVMAKALRAPYEAGRRGAAWLKVKPVRTVDLVVIAAEWGSGRRRGRLSNLHLGARDPQSGGFAMVGKTFKGMTDEMLAWQTERFLALALGRERHVVHVRPEVVVEIAFDGVQRSSHYESGLALRFARVKSYRTDKRAADADPIDALRALLAPASASP